MNKYKVGDKIVLTVSDVNEKAYYSYYVFNDNDLIRWEPSTDKYAEPLSTYTEPLEAKIRRQAAEITRLLAENKELKEDKAVLNAKIDAYKLYGDQHEEEYNQTFNKGAETAWELARKIAVVPKEGGCTGRELFEIFNTATISKIFSLTYPEAAAKVEAWEKAKEEIKVGDIFQDNDGNNAIVTSIKGNTVYYMWDDGDTRSGFAEDVKKHFTKTGRHIDIDSFLKQIGGNENER